ncbi:histidine kinase [Desulfotomaculum varum]
MKNFKRISLYYKVNGIIIGILLLLSLAGWMIIKQAVVGLLGQQLEQRGQEVGNYIAALSANDILLENYYNLYELINKTRENARDLKYILITDYNGHVIVHSFAGGLPAGLKNLRGINDKQVIRYESNEGFIREVQVPVEEGQVGYVRIGMSEQGMQQLLQSITQKIMLGIIAVCCLAGLLATRLTSRLIHPIYKLAQAVRKIEQGNYRVKVESQTKDEIGCLTSAFNEMATSLEQKERENTHLVSELKQKEAMRDYLIKRLITVQEDERRRISRELHDEASQSITSLLAYMKVLQIQINQKELQEIIAKARDIVLDLLAEVKRIAVELRPPILDDHGVVPAMERYINNFSQQYCLPVSFETTVADAAFNNQSALALYRILQEGLTNVAKHAAASEVQVVLSARRQGTVLVICDNGGGAAGQNLTNLRQRHHLGLYGMKERTELLGGKFTFCSVPGETILAVYLPQGGYDEREDTGNAG